MAATAHIAGPMGDDYVQRCVRCKVVLLDLQGCEVPEGNTIGSWKPGAHVVARLSRPWRWTAVRRKPQTVSLCNAMPTQEQKHGPKDALPLAPGPALERADVNAALDILKKGPTT